MPTAKTKKTRVPTPEAESPATVIHPIRHHRPIITMAVGFGIMLAISAMILANNRVRTIIVQQFAQETITIDTTNWPSYTEPSTHLTFKYPSDWTVKTMASSSDRAIIISPEKDTSIKISIYISPSGYLGFDGLPTTPTTLNGLPAIAVANTLLGLERIGNYFTFDAGLHASSAPTFHAILKTVQF